MVAPRALRGKGCVLMLFDPDPADEDPAVVIEAVNYDARCTADDTPDLVRKYGTRSMVLGAMHAVMRRAARAYPHLSEFQLADEASYPCAQLPPHRVKTYATDLLLFDRTYYERHLGVALAKPRDLRVAEEVRRRVRGPIDLTFDAFWSAVATATDAQPPELGAWLEARRAAVQRLFEGAATWRAFFQRAHARWNCAFFAACWYQLCGLFGMRSLLGALYRVAFKDVPAVPGGAAVRLRRVNTDRAEQKGESSTHTAGGGARRSSSTTPIARRLARLRRLHAELERTSLERHGVVNGVLLA